MNTLNLTGSVKELKEYLINLTREELITLFSSLVFLSYRLSYEIIKTNSLKHSRVFSVMLINDYGIITASVQRVGERPFRVVIVNLNNEESKNEQK